MNILLRSSIITLVLSLSIWTIAVSFTPISSAFQSGSQVSAETFNSLFELINNNFKDAELAINNNLEDIASNKAALDALPESNVVPAISIGVSESQTIASGSGSFMIWTRSIFETANLHNPQENPARLTITENGIYQINANVVWSANPTGLRALVLTKNGASVLAASSEAIAQSNTDVSLSDVLSLEQGDFLEIFAVQNSGAELTTANVAASKFSLYKVSDLP